MGYTYRGPDAGEMFLKDILQEERVIKDWMETNKAEAESTTDQEEDEFEQEKNCYVCGERFIKRYVSSLISHHLEKIKSIKMVKKQKRLVSMELHRDKQVGVCEEEIKQKEEKLKLFNVSNEKLKKYLMDNQLFEDDEEEEIFEDEDDFSDEKK